MMPPGGHGRWRPARVVTQSLLLSMLMIVIMVGLLSPSNEVVVTRDVVFASPGPAGTLGPSPTATSGPPKSATPLKCGMSVEGLDEETIEALVFLETAMIERQDRFLTNPQSPESKFVMFHCDGRHRSRGGLGDRMVGLMDAFAFAVVLERALIISWDQYTPLSRYLRPNVLWWDSTFFDQGAFDGEEDIFDCYDVCPRGLWHGSIEFPGRLLHIESNLPFAGAIYDNPHPNNAKYRMDLLNGKHGLVFRFMFHLLFKLSPEMHDVFAPFARVLHPPDRTHTVIGVHVRTGGMGAWQDPSFGNEELYDVYKQYAVMLYNTVPGLNARPLRFMVITDSAELLEEARFADRTIMSSDSTGLPITHIDRPGPDTFEWSARAFLDVFLLASADALVISRSGFSEHASALSCAPTVAMLTPMNPSREFAGDEGRVLTRGLCTPLPSREEGHLSNLDPGQYGDSLMTFKEAKEAAQAGRNVFAPGALKYVG